MFINKKTILTTFIISIVVGLMLLFLSLSMMGIVMSNFDTGIELSLYGKIIYYAGMVISGYLMLPVFILPAYIQNSLLGGVLSYIFAIFMTWILVAPAYIYLKKVIARRKS